MQSFIHPHALENRLKVLTALARESNLSKYELAQASGLSRADMSYHVRYLEKTNLIEASAPQLGPQPPGRPGLRYQLRKDSFSLLVVQVELPKVRVSWAVGDMAEVNTIVEKVSAKTQDSLLTALLSLIAKALKERKTDLPKKADPRIFISFAGVSDRNVLSSVDGITSWRPFHLTPHFSRTLGAPVRILNASALLAIGYSADRGGQNVFVATLKRREKIFRYAEMINGKLAFGERGSSGLLGHLKVPGFDGPCYCGAKGCLEGYLISDEPFSQKKSALLTAMESAVGHRGSSKKKDLVFSIRGWPAPKFDENASQPGKLLCEDEEIELINLGARIVALEEIYREILLAPPPSV